MDDTCLTPTVKKSTNNQSMADALCTGSVHADLVEHGVEAVIDKWPELTGYDDLLKSILNSERCRAAHIRCAEQEEQAIEKAWTVLAAQLT